ncbi:MAG TPA: hypothetical protein PL001_09085, partial [Candidatus Kryptobacter bacterium]|nr:hypothetical protein [Candidatus Kryptobacter bacterium]
NAVTRNGRTYIVLGKGVLQREGIEVTAVQTRSEALTVSAFGKVVMPQDLAADASMYSAAYSAYKAAASRKDASEKEYERQKTLNATKNVSDKAFQAAAAKYDADAAEANSTLQNLLSVKTRILEKWGTVVAGWLESASSRRSSRLLEAKDLLVEASLPSGAGLLRNIRYGVIVSSDGKNAKAEYLSPAPSVNPEIQGPIYFFILPAVSSSLLPGMNVTVHISAGKEMSGVFVPSSAVVWLNGGTWIYVETQEDEFTRQSLFDSRPVAGGYFVTYGLKAGNRVVIKGAQLLLSQEFMGASSGGDD